MFIPSCLSHARNNLIKSKAALIALVVVSILITDAEVARAETIRVKAGGDVQSAIDAAQAGDTIILEAGATYSGPLVLRRKPEAAPGSDPWITITSSRSAELPEGRRVGPERAPLMPKVVSPGGNYPAVRTEAGAHHYRLVGLEVMPRAPDAYVRELIQLGSGDPAEQNAGRLEVVPRHLVIERCLIHAWPEQEVVRAVALNSAHTRISDCHISDIKNSGFDAQAVYGWNGPGPYQITNNFLEASGEVAAFGDGEAGRLTAADVLFSRNHVTKRLSWRGRYLIKNLFEIKQATRVKVDGNLFEHNWQHGQDGNALVFTAGRAEASYIEVSNNVVRKSGSGIGITNYGVNGLTHHITIRNNLFDQIGEGEFGGRGAFLVIEGTPYVTLDHNTVVHTGTLVVATGEAAGGGVLAIKDFVFTNNVARHNEYGIFGGGQQPGNQTVAAYFPGGVFRGNVIAGLRYWAYPEGNHYPATLDEVGFVDLAGGIFKLAPTSRYRRRGTDGKDVGADMSAIESALAEGDLSSSSSK